MWKMNSEKPNRKLLGCLFLLLSLWITYLAFSLWSYAAVETEPPVFDALSYVQKAQTFWHAIHEGRPFNPLSLEPTIRPFGTVLLSYPFGYSEDFRGFYFRSMFIPILVLAATFLFVAPMKSTKQMFMIFVVAILATSAPSNFQLQIRESARSVLGTWGFVDTFFASVLALATALVIKNDQNRNVQYAWAGASVAAFSIFIKPAGAMLMVVLGMTWLIIHCPRKLRHPQESKPFIQGVLAFVVVYGLVFLALFKSDYFADEHAKYGLRGMELLQGMQFNLQISDILQKFHVSIGVSLSLVLLAGIAIAVQKEWRRHLFAATLILLSGFWLWLIRTNVDHVRYFLPFQMMALVVMAPPFVEAVSRLSYKWISCISILLLAPTALIAALLSLQSPPDALQRLAGINLASNVHASVVSDAVKLREKLAKEGLEQNIIYYAGTSPKVRAFEAVFDFDRLVGGSRAHSIPALPIDWVREHSYRLNEIRNARFVVFEPVQNPDQILSRTTSVETFSNEEVVIRAWLSSLSERDGVHHILNGSAIHVVEISDINAFDKASEELYNRFSWRDAFQAGYSQRWATESDVAALKNNLVATPLEFSFEEHAIASVVAATFIRTEKEFQLDLYMRRISPIPTSLPAKPWYVFVHLLNRDGSIKGIQHIPLEAHAVRASFVQKYISRIANDGAKEPLKIAFGIFSPQSTEQFHLFSQGGDWEGRRVILEGFY